MALIEKYIDGLASPGGAGTEGDPYGGWIEWEANEGTNLVTDGNTHVVYVKNEDIETNSLLINGFTDDATHYVTIKAWPGHEVNGSYATGGAFKTSVASRAILNYAEFLRMEDIRVESIDTGSGQLLQQVWAGSKDIRHDRCVFVTAQSGNMLVGSSNQTGSVLFRNCILDATNLIDTSLDTGKYYFYNNTMFGRTIVRAVGDVVSKNNLIDAANAYLVYVGSTLTGTNNTHSESDQSDYSSGTGNIFSQTFTYTNAAANDYSLASGDTGAIDKGTGLTSDSAWPFSIDITSAARGATWDCGAFEYIAAGGVTIPVIMNHLRNQGIN